MNKAKFSEAITRAYSFSFPSIHLGSGVLEGEVMASASVNLPLRNR